MGRAPRQPKPVEAFGPEVFQALVEGSKREIVLELPYRKAVMFRQRANSLRASMRASGHEQYKVVSQTNLRIVWGSEAGYEDVPERKSSQNVRAPVSKNAPAKLIISPSDSEFSEALRKAGVEIRPLGSEPPLNTEAPPAQPGPETDVLEAYVKGEPNAAD